MQFEYDPEQLIEEVKKRPGIWDYDHPDYRARSEKVKKWHEVIKSLMSLTESNLTKTEMNELELQLKKKWKSMRDSYQKYLLNPQKTKRPYIYAKQLQFILKDKKYPVLKRKVTQVSESEDDEDTPKNLWVKKKKKINLLKTEEESGDDVDADQDDFYEISQPEVKSVQQEGQFAFADVESKSDSDDPDKLFLMSLLPHLRSIPEEFRLNAKLDLMQVLKVANESTAKLKYSSGLD